MASTPILASTIHSPTPSPPPLTPNSTFEGDTSLHTCPAKRPWIHRTFSLLFRRASHAFSLSSSTISKPCLPTKNLNKSAEALTRDRSSTVIHKHPPTLLTQSLLRRFTFSHPHIPSSSASSSETLYTPPTLTFDSLYESLGYTIGTGISGTVDAYRDRITDTPVAVKIFHSPKDISPSISKYGMDRYVQRVTREIEALRRLKECKYVAELEAVFDEYLPANSSVEKRSKKEKSERQRVMRIVMPLYPRELFSFITKPASSESNIITDAKQEEDGVFKPPPPIEKHVRHRLIRELITAVTYMHAHGVVHRDIKLENICLDKNDSVKFVDFGSCLLFNPVSSPDYCLSEGVHGSDPYIAPEIFLAQQDPYPSSYNAIPADAWSLGVVILALIRRSFLWDKADEATDRAFKSVMRKPARVFIGLDKEGIELDEWERKVVLGLLEQEPLNRLLPKDVLKIVRKGLETQD